jgi:hypothetical protein
MSGLPINFMFTLLVLITAFALVFVAGFYAGIKNANSSKVDAGKELLRKLKSKD